MGIECASRVSPGPAARRIAAGAWLTAVLVLTVTCGGGGDNPRPPTRTAWSPGRALGGSHHRPLGDD